MSGPDLDDEKLSEGPLGPNEIQALRLMVRDYQRAKWLRRQMKYWFVWIIGAPVAIASTWQASHTIYDFFTKAWRGP